MNTQETTGGHYSKLQGEKRWFLTAGLGGNENDYHVGAPFSRDTIGELAQACRKANFRFGLYFASDNWYYTESGEYEQSVEAYSAFVGGMLDELMTNYGPVCELWLDGSTPLLPPTHLGPLLASCREKQPGMVINDRGVNQDEHGLPFGDFVTRERFYFRPSQRLYQEQNGGRI